MSEPLDVGSSFWSVGPWNKGIRVAATHPEFRVWLTLEHGASNPLSLEPAQARRLAELLLAEAAKAEAGKDQPCVECKGADSEERYGWKCFTCKFWLDLVVLGADGRSLILDGVHRRLGLKGVDVPAQLRGSAGRKAVIHYIDGRTAETVDLWYQGVIPARFRDRLPDNVARMEWP